MKLPDAHGFAETFSLADGAFVSSVPLVDGVYGSIPAEVSAPATGTAGYRVILEAIAPQEWTLPDGEVVAFSDDENLGSAVIALSFDSAGQLVDLIRANDSLPKANGGSFSAAAGGHFGTHRTAIAGRWSGVGLAFGLGTDREVTFTMPAENNPRDAWAATFDADGAFACAWGFQSPEWTDVNDALVLDDGTVIVVGAYTSPLTITDGTPRLAQLEKGLGNPGLDGFIAAFRPTQRSKR